MAYPRPSASVLLPPHFYPEDFYSPLSIWALGVPPPSVYIHVRTYSVRTDIPLGRLDRGDGEDIAGGTLQEQEVFAVWLRGVWREKDELMGRFYATGSFVESASSSEDDLKSVTQTKGGGRMETILPMRLTKWHEYLAACSYFIPPLVLYLGVPVVWRILKLAAGILLGEGNWIRRDDL